MTPGSLGFSAVNFVHILLKGDLVEVITERKRFKVRVGRRRRSLQPGHKGVSVLDMVVVKRISVLGLVVVILIKGGLIVTESLLDKQVVLLDRNWMRKVMDLRSVERRRRRSCCRHRKCQPGVVVVEWWHCGCRGRRRRRCCWCCC